MLMQLKKGKIQGEVAKDLFLQQELICRGVNSGFLERVEEEWSGTCFQRKNDTQTNDWK